MIDHEMHKIRIKAVSDKLGHPMEYNDAGAPKMTHEERYHAAYKKDYEAMEEAHRKRKHLNAHEDAKIIEKAISKILR